MSTAHLHEPFVSQSYNTLPKQLQDEHSINTPRSDTNYYDIENQTLTSYQIDCRSKEFCRPFAIILLIFLIALAIFIIYLLIKYLKII